MKKILLIGIFILLITGCGKGQKIVCTKKTDNIENEISAIIKNDKTESLEIKVKFDKSKYTDEQIKSFESIDLCNNIVNYIGLQIDNCRQKSTKTNIVLSGTISIKEEEKMNKSNFKESQELAGYTCK